MFVNEDLKRFVEESPVTVMARVAMQQALSAQWVDALFEQHRQRQYTRELLFSKVVELMTLVVLGGGLRCMRRPRRPRICQFRSRRSTTSSIEPIRW